MPCVVDMSVLLARHSVQTRRRCWLVICVGRWAVLSKLRKARMASGEAMVEQVDRYEAQVAICRTSILASGR